MPVTPPLYAMQFPFYALGNYGEVAYPDEFKARTGPKREKDYRHICEYYRAKPPTVRYFIHVLLSISALTMRALDSYNHAGASSNRG